MLVLYALSASLCCPESTDISKSLSNIQAFVSVRMPYCQQPFIVVLVNCRWINGRTRHISIILCQISPPPPRYYSSAVDSLQAWFSLLRFFFFSWGGTAQRIEIQHALNLTNTSLGITMLV